MNPETELPEKLDDVSYTESVTWLDIMRENTRQHQRQGVDARIFLNDALRNNDDKGGERDETASFMYWNGINNSLTQIWKDPQP